LLWQPRKNDESGFYRHRGLLRSHSNIIRVSKADEEKAKRIIFGYRDKEFSFCDATSFALIEKLRIKEAMAFDRHFGQYGKFGLLRE